MAEVRVDIRAVAYALPRDEVTNEMLAIEHPEWDMARVAARTGVAARRVARPSETAFDLARQACDALFAENPGQLAEVDAILFCTQTGDYVMPPNSSLLHGSLGLKQDVFALDYNLACSGFVYGLALAQGLILGGVASNIMLVTADTYSKFINSRDRAARALFGDGAAATLIGPSESGRGLVDVICATSGKDHRRFMIPAGGLRLQRTAETAIPHVDSSGNYRSLEDIHMDGAGVLAFVNAAVPAQVETLLARNSLTVADLDLVIFHQASQMAIDSLTRRLSIPREKVFVNIGRIGNTVSASIPIAIRDAIDQGVLRPGHRVLLSGFGVGMSWATAIWQA
jgi:3-oxoacyl-[acyl-carrier-protein] synthase-3